MLRREPRTLQATTRLLLFSDSALHDPQRPYSLVSSPHLSSPRRVWSPRPPALDAEQAAASPQLTQNPKRQESGPRDAPGLLTRSLGGGTVWHQCPRKVTLGI